MYQYECGRPIGGRLDDGQAAVAGLAEAEVGGAGREAADLGSMLNFFKHFRQKMGKQFAIYD
jgi:hypothetical protein